MENPETTESTLLTLIGGVIVVNTLWITLGFTQPPSREVLFLPALTSNVFSFASLELIYFFILFPSRYLRGVTLLEGQRSFPP